MRTPSYPNSRLGFYSRLLAAWLVASVGTAMGQDSDYKPLGWEQGSVSPSVVDLPSSGPSPVVNPQDVPGYNAQKDRKDTKPAATTTGSSTGGSNGSNGPQSGKPVWGDPATDGQTPQGQWNNYNAAPGGRPNGAVKINSRNGNSLVVPTYNGSPVPPQANQKRDVPKDADAEILRLKAEQDKTDKSDKTDKQPAQAPSMAARLQGGPDRPAGAAGSQQLHISNSHNPKRGISVQQQVPAVRHVTMSPASKKFGGDEVELVISPIYNVMLQMPDAVELVDISSSLLTGSVVQTNANLVILKLANLDKPVPISLHIVDVNQNIYTFSVIGQPVDLAWEYAKTIVVNRRTTNKTKIGPQNPQSVIAAMDVDDAIQMVVGDVPNTSEYDVQFLYANFVHYDDFVLYAFRIFRKDHKSIPRDKSGQPDLNFNIWANDKRLDGGSQYAASREIEWSIGDLLSKRDSRRSGYEVLRVFVQIRADILDLEDWTRSFITVANQAGYSRSDFTPLMRPSRAPVNPQE